MDRQLIIYWLNLDILIKLNRRNMEGQFTIPLKEIDGKFMKMQIRMKNVNGKRRKVKTWTAEQDSQLLKLYQQHPKKWATIASLMHDRNQNQCLHRYRRLSQLGANRKIWSSEQDETVKKLIKKIGKNWKVLSETLGTKTGKQIRERFINKLDPRIKKEEWSDEEDRLLIQLYSELGSKWSEISKRLVGRPENKIKNRFYSFIQKNYDIKYKVMNTNQPTQPQPKRQEFAQIRENQLLHHYYNPFSKNQIPSINEIEMDFKDNKENTFSLGSKFYLRSLIKIEDQSVNNHRYRSIHQLSSHNEFPDENDLLYMPPN